MKIGGRGGTYLALGDSYTIGEGVGQAERWPMLLTAALRRAGVPMRDPTYVAQTGWTAANLQAAVNAQSFFDPFSLVTLQIGVNDQYQGLPLAEYETTLDQLLIQAIQLVGGSPDRVIAVSIPDWSVTPFAKGRPQARLRREIDSFNHVFSARATEVSVCLVDITPLSRQARHAAALLAVDGLHPSGRLYRKWADLVLPQALAALSPGHLRP